MSANHSAIPDQYGELSPDSPASSQFVVWGGLLSLSGNVIGAGIACQLMRVFIGERAEKYLAPSALARYEERITRRGARVIFLLRVNPLTSSDLVSARPECPAGFGSTVKRGASPHIAAI